MAYAIFFACAANFSLEAITYIEMIKPMKKFQKALKKLKTPFERDLIISLNCGIMVLSIKLSS